MDYELAKIMYELHKFMNELEGEQKERLKLMVEDLQEVLTEIPF